MLSDFYRSKEWSKFRSVVINDRLVNGVNICEYCGKPILRPYDLILHHKEYLTEENYRDANISLNPDNIQLIHHSCHNKIHDKLGYYKREVYIVYGSPLAGKTSYVNSVKSRGDLIIDMDLIWYAVSGCEMYDKPRKLNAVVFSIRDKLLELARYRVGKWSNCYIIGTYPYEAERERLANELGARLIHIDTTESECIDRLNHSTDRDKEVWLQFIRDYWSVVNGNY